MQRLLPLVSPRDVTEEVLYGILAVFTAIYAFCRLPLTLGRGNMAQDIYTGIKFTVLTLAFLQGFTPWFAWSYVLTLVTMGTFLFSLIVGYWRKVQGLVHYALIAATLWTLKLLYDFSSSDSLSFLISIFGTSLVLFGMQVLYEKLDADKRYAYSSALRAVQHVMLAVSALLIAFVPYQGTAETVVSVLLAVLSMAWLSGGRRSLWAVLPVRKTFWRELSSPCWCWRWYKGIRIGLQALMSSA